MYVIHELTPCSVDKFSVNGKMQFVSVKKNLNNAEYSVVSFKSSVESHQSCIWT